MSILAWIIVSSLLGGALSVAAAALFAFSARASMVPLLVSYAIGALLGAVFLEILPHAFELNHDVHTMAGTVLFGILLFFTLEKLVLWRHCHHTDECEVHGVHEGHTDHGRSGMMIMVGDTFHNFVDGILIAAAFMVDVQVGVVTSLAIIAHEIPQEVGDFLILLHSGYTKRQAFTFNLLSSLATMVGGVLAYFALQSLQGAGALFSRHCGGEHDLRGGGGPDSGPAQASGNQGDGAAGNANRPWNRFHLADRMLLGGHA